MANVSFIEAVQSRTARVAVSASATRGQGAGVVLAGRSFLARLPLKEFAVRRPEVFRTRLNATTVALCSALPPDARSWGLARKLLNIFLRDALYTTYLAAEFQLGEAEPLFEIPLDSITARHLREEAGSRRLPRWLGVRRLTPEVSDSYQAFAAQLAGTWSLAPIHLDSYWWGHRDS